MDSNHRSSACKAGVFAARRRDRTVTRGRLELPRPRGAEVLSLVCLPLPPPGRSASGTGASPAKLRIQESHLNAGLMKPGRTLVHPHKKQSQGSDLNRRRTAYETALGTGLQSTLRCLSDQGETCTPTPLRARGSEPRASADSATWP